MEGFYAEVEDVKTHSGVAAHSDMDVPTSTVPMTDKEEKDSKKSDSSPEEDTVETYEMEGFGNYGATFSVMEFVKRLLKYLVEGLVVAIAASTIPKKSLDIQEVGVIALSAAATFALLDLFAPTISYAARQGAGFGVGANLVGFPRL
jgi:hypothetical protein